MWGCVSTQGWWRLFDHQFQFQCLGTLLLAFANLLIVNTLKVNSFLSNGNTQSDSQIDVLLTSSSNRLLCTEAQLKLSVTFDPLQTFKEHDHREQVVCPENPQHSHTESGLKQVTQYTHSAILMYVTQ